MTFTRVPLSVLIARNKLTYKVPLIGINFDYRYESRDSSNQEVKQIEYIEEFVNEFKKTIKDAGAELYFIHPGDSLEKLKQLDGLIIPGSRDFHSKHYGEELHKDSRYEPDTDIHFERCKEIYRVLDCPVLGICGGMQFLNVLHGGTLVQHLDHADKHQCHVNTIRQERGSRLERVLGAECRGFCYHHQGIGKLAKGFRVTSVDSEHGYPHGIESTDPGRTVFGVIWHPEKVSNPEYDCSPNNLQLFKELVLEAEKFRQRRNSPRKTSKPRLSPRFKQVSSEAL